MYPRSFPQRSLLGPPYFGFGWAEGVPTTFIPNQPGTMASKPIILEPQSRVHFPKVFQDVGRWSVPRWEDGVEDVSAKGLRSWQVKARALFLATIVASTTTRVVAVASSLPCIAVGTPTGVEGVPRITVVAKTLMHWDRGTQPTALLRLVD